ncbi:biotin--[acetyl-CoA-carboxylase] ligase, partial [Campylobacter sp. 2018MI27]|nr:biotin--[acetyl-CoA-carboxylase] ligase [Campylobacter sp. 2018MI27]
MIMKIVLKEFGSKVFIKWPNEFYLDNKKIGGLITAKIKNKLVCGIGINITTAPVDANILDIDISYSTLLKTFFDRINLNISWKEIFDYYKSDFELSRSFYFKNDDNTYSLNDVKLYEDGSILVDNKRIYSLR